MNTRLKSLIFILLFVVFYAIYYWVVPAVIDIEHRIPLIQKFLKENLDLGVEIKNPKIKMSLLPAFWLDADEFRIIDNGNTTPLLISKPKIKIRLLPLLIGKINVGYFSCNKMDAKLRFDKHSRFYMGNYLFIESSNPIISLKNSKILIDDYDIYLKDEQQQKDIELEGDYLDLLGYNPKKYIKFSTNSRIKVDNHLSKINVDVNLKLPLKKNFEDGKITFEGTVTNLDLNDFSSFVKIFSKRKITKTEGLINLFSKNKQIGSDTTQITTEIVAKNFLINDSKNSAYMAFKDKLVLETVFNVSKNKLDILDFKLNSEKIHTKLSGKISRITSKNPFLNLKCIINNSRTEDFISLMPPIKEINDIMDVQKLKKYVIYSDINSDLTIKGHKNRPHIYGETTIKNAYLGITNSNPKLDLGLIFTGNDFKMNIYAPLSDKEHVKILGEYKLHDDKYGTLDISTTDNVSLHTVQSVLVPLHEIFYFDLGPLPIMTLNGTGSINIKTKGTSTDPHLFGELKFKNTSLAFDKVDLLITNGTGALLFKDKQTYFSTKSAYLNGQPISVKGKTFPDGSIDYEVVAKGQNLNGLMDILKNSELLKDLRKIQLPNRATGDANLSIKLYGKAKNIYDINFGKNINTKGELTLLDNDVWVNDFDLPINVKGTIKFENTNLDMNLLTALQKSKVSLKGKVKNNLADINFKSNSLNLGEVLSYVPQSETKNFRMFPSLYKTNLGLDAYYVGSTEKIDISNLSFKGKLFPTIQKNANMQIKSGNIELNHSILKFSKILGSYKRNNFSASGDIKNIFKKNQVINCTFTSNNFDISALANISKYPLIPDYMRNSLAKFANQTGHVNVNAIVKNNIFNTKLKLQDISFTYTPIMLPIKVYSGIAEIKDDKLMLFKVNSILDSMPILVDGTIDNIYINPDFNLYVNSKPDQRFIEKYINKHAIYPLKLKGDIIYSSRIRGTKDLLNAKAEINMEKDSNIYYMGSTLGDTNNPIRVYIDTNMSKRYIYVNNFQYDKLISSQNNKEFVSQQLNAKGQINLNNGAINLQNFKVKTQNPTDAKIFNIIFKKPMVKQGLFTSNVNINGPIASPQMRGQVNFTGVNIPLLETTIKDISLDFKDKTIDIKSTGEIFTNKILFSSVMKNQLSPPYTFKTIDIYFENFDINSVIKSVENIQFEAGKHKISESKQDIDVSNVIIEDAKLKADNVKVKNIQASNLLAKVSLNENLVFSLDNFQFNIANGSVKGDFKHNLLNSNTHLDMSVNNVDANQMTEALFDLKNQIFGSLTGEVVLTCNDKTHKQCMDTLSGHGGFSVVNGRMPKLGSLEYLLKASNLVKSGLTGLSINGIIDLVTPLKTGQFDAIRGDFEISSGKADNIQIFSKGKDLSLFLTGAYNFSTLIADMTVFGRLSKKITNVLGPIGNASLNTLFNTIPGLNLDETNKTQILEGINKIPGIELNDQLYRVFSVKIYGDINGDKYVQSFKWIE